MGCFSNGTDGMIYQADWCDNCVHDLEWRTKQENPCPVWSMHLLCASGAKEGSDIHNALESFIPIADGENLKCKMYLNSNEDNGLLVSAEYDRRTVEPGLK